MVQPRDIHNGVAQGGCHVHLPDAAAKRSVRCVELARKVVPQMALRCSTGRNDRFVTVDVPCGELT
jgi:hypothetical protein